MRFLENESGATRTEYSLIAAGMAFAVTLGALPPSIKFARPIAALVLLLAWGAAAWCWGESAHSHAGFFAGRLGVRRRKSVRAGMATASLAGG